MKSKDDAFKKELLGEAVGQYYILSKINPNDIDTLIQLGRIYDYENKNSYAKGYFYRALEINKNYAPTNYYFGDYYYSRKEYKKALYYYEIAFKNGYKEDYDTIIKLANIYEKLGDLLRANQYYKKAFLLKKENSEIADKIREMESLNYKNSGYYNKRRKKDNTK
jgi:Tfp pilus assembly protein PilF